MGGPRAGPASVSSSQTFGFLAGALGFLAGVEAGGEAAAGSPASLDRSPDAGKLWPHFGHVMTFPAGTGRGDFKWAEQRGHVTRNLDIRACVLRAIRPRSCATAG